MSTQNQSSEVKQSRRSTRSLFLAFGILISSWAPMVPFAKIRLGLDDAQLGLVLLMFGIGALLTIPFSGWLINRLGIRFMTLFSGIPVVLLLPFLTIADTPFFMGIILFLFGASTGAMNVAINSQAVAVESHSERPIMSGFHCLFSTGGLLGALIVSVLLELKFDLIYCALAISLTMLLILMKHWRHLVSSGPGSNLDPVHKKKGLLDRKVLCLGGMCFIAFMSEGSMLDWSAEFLRSSLHYEATIAGIGYALFSIAMAAGRLIGDKMIERFGSSFIFQACTFIAAVGFFSVTFLSWVHAELLGFVLIGLGASNIVPILFSTSGKSSATNSAYSLTIVTTVGYVGMLIGPAFIGFVAKAITLPYAFMGIALLLVAVGLSGRFLVFLPVDDR